MQVNKFYIIAMAASGKSTFATRQSTYRGYHVVDYAEHLPEITLLTKVIQYLSRLIKPLRKAVRHRPDVVARRQKNYFTNVFQFIDDHEQPLVILGRRPPEEFKELPVHDRVKFALVLIPEDDHRRNCASRKKELRNPLPYFHHWTTDFEKISALRSSLRKYAEDRDIPVYDSFTGAIDDMHERFSGAEHA